MDAGCGLGGAAIFWAQRFGATVTAVTIAEGHIPCIAQFAAAAGVAGRVRPLLRDAVTVPGENRFDAIIAIESSCHMPRPELFQRLAKLVRPGGRVFVEDYLTVDRGIRDLFTEHWVSPLGSRDEYVSAAEAAGLRLVATRELTDAIAPYWELSSRLVQLDQELTPEHRARSAQVHGAVGSWMQTHRLQSLMMAFERPGSSVYER
jgi:tocopherol O-methyltransferase